MRTAVKILLLMGRGITYSLLDLFTTDRAAGSVNGTAAEPTGQTRTVTDTNSKLSLAGGKASVATGGVGSSNPRLSYPLETRVAGKTLLATVNVSVNALRIGWTTDIAGVIDFNFTPIVLNALYVTDNGAGILVGSNVAGDTDYQVAVVLRSTGCFYFYKGGTDTTWKLVWVSVQGTGNLYPAFTSTYTTDVYTVDNFRIPNALYIPNPIAYDTFTRANGALGSTEATGADGQLLTPIAWSSAIGTWAISSNKATASALSGGLAIATISVSTKGNIVEAALTRSAGIVGVVGRYTDSDNYIYAYHDGTNAGIKQRLAGVETDLIAATAATYSASAILRLVMDGNSCLLFYNNARVGATGTINAGLSGTIDGLYTTDTGNTHDLVTVWARGTSNEYAGLDTF